MISLRKIISEFSTTNTIAYKKYIKNAKAELFKLYNSTKDPDIINLWKELDNLTIKIEKTIDKD